MQERVVRAEWCEAEARWTVETEAGPTYTARVLVNGCGILAVPRQPVLISKEHHLSYVNYLRLSWFLSAADLFIRQTCLAQ